MLEEGSGRLERVTLSGGFALPKSATWTIKERADGQPVRTDSVQVRSVETEVGPLTSSLFQDNGSSIYRMAIHSGNNWAPQNFRWVLTLRNAATGQAVRTYNGDISDNTERNREFFQIFDGKNQAGEMLPLGVPITPELSIIVLNESSPTLQASRVALAQAEDCGCEEEWVLTGGGVPFRIDDDLELFLNGVSIFRDDSGTADYFNEIPFQAKVGDSLRLAAKDTFGICSEVDPIYVTRTSTGTRLKLTPGYDGPCDDSAHGLIFFDETYILTDDPKIVEAVFNSNGADLANETREACEALAWTRTASVPPPPPKGAPTGGVKSGSQGPPPYSQSAGTPYLGAINNTFNIPGQYTAANYPGISQTMGDINALFYNWMNNPNQMGFFSPIPIAINKGSGRYTHAFNDLVVYTRSAPLYLGRTHASDQQGRPGNFGWNWSFDEKMIVFQNLVLYQLPDGNATVYQDDGEGYRPTMSHNTTQLTRVDERTFRFDYKGGGSSLFQIPAGLTPDSEHPVLAVLQTTTDTNGISNTFKWDSTGQRLLKMQGPDPSQFIRLQWQDGDHPKLLSACDSHGRTVCYDYSAFTSPQGERDYLLSEVTLTGDRSIQFRYHPVLGRRQYELLDVSHNKVIQEKVVANPKSPGQIKEVTHRPDKTLTFTRQVDEESGEVSTTFTQKSASNNSPGGLSQSLRYQIDDEDRVVSVKDDLENEIHYEWDENENIVHVFDNEGHDFRFEFDERRNIRSAQDQLGRVSRMEWDAQDNLVASEDTLSRRTTSTFDDRRNPLSVTDNLGHTTSIAWNEFGSPTSITDSLGNSVLMEYSSKGFLEAIQLPATTEHGPARTTVERNQADEVIRSIDPLGRVYKCKRDALGRVVEGISPAVQGRYRQQALPAARTHAKYNRNDQIQSLTSVDGRVTSYRYDLAERLIEVQETGYPAPTRLTWDAFDNLTSITRPNGATTVYHRDRLNRVVRVQYPGGDEETLSYDSRGRVSEWHSGSRVVFYEYDSVDRLVHMSCPTTGDDYRYTFDDADRMMALEDQTGTTTYKYTGNDLLQKITHPGNKAIVYGYDPGDRLVSTLDPENVLTEYTYNQRNQLVQARHDEQVVSYSHDLLGRATEIQLPNGVRGQQVFDERDRLLLRRYQKGCNPLITLKYAYNQLGQRVLDDRTMPDGHQLARFTYNQRLELIKSKRERGGCAPPEVHTYAYDLNHNRIEADGVNYSNNLADQLLSVGAGGSLTYNDAGQAQNVQGWDVTYNCADQITGIQMPGKSIAYRYDGAGQRVQKTVNGVTQKFLWNGGDIAKEYNADDSVKADYFLGAGREGIKTDGQWHYYLSDIQGSTLMLTDSSGNSAATYDFSDFGETRQTSGSTSLYNPFLYTGQEYDFETSLYHLRARHYSPALGRFFARDPIGYAGGRNMYAYCAGDPIGCTDPSGLALVTLYDRPQRMFDLQLDPEGRSGTTATFNVSLVWDTGSSNVTLNLSNIINSGLTNLVFSGNVDIKPKGGGLKTRLPKGGPFRFEVPGARSISIPAVNKSKSWQIGSPCGFDFTLNISAQHDPLTFMAPNGLLALRVFRALPIFATGKAQLP